MSLAQVASDDTLQGLMSSEQALRDVGAEAPRFALVHPEVHSAVKDTLNAMSITTRHLETTEAGSSSLWLKEGMRPSFYKFQASAPLTPTENAHREHVMQSSLPSRLH